MKRKAILAAAAAMLAAACPACAAGEPDELAAMIVRETCAKSSEPCAEKEYAFTAMADVDRRVLQACERLTANEGACWDLVVADCGALARVMVPEAAENLDCAAGQAGDGCFLDCWTPDGMGDAGSRLCAAWAAACGLDACESGWGLFFDVISPWMRPGVVEAVEACLGETACESLGRCIDAWSEAAGFSLVIG